LESHLDMIAAALRVMAHDQRQRLKSYDLRLPYLLGAMAPLGSFPPRSRRVEDGPRVPAGDHYHDHRDEAEQAEGDPQRDQYQYVARSTWHDQQPFQQPQPA
ncbi:hypothetical protein, partial [Nonomuraea fuscirosea]|uniref:hypothetical protein n=1 Tax=Nonomuraea fuscirosea TaxID=1291556 RepID=UPI003438D613